MGRGGRGADAGAAGNGAAGRIGRGRRLLAGARALALGCAALLAAGCAMTQSTLTDVTAGRHDVACRSNAGSYFLPKTIFRVGLTKRTTAGGTANERSYFELSYLAAIRRSDGTKPYCLDYLANVSSDDEINVVKYTGRLAVGTGDQRLAAAKKELGLREIDDKVLLDRITSLELANAQFDPNLLRYVMSDAVDQSAYIAETLIKSIFLGVAGASATVRGAGLAEPTSGLQRVAELDFDPFDPVQSAVVNESLKDFGFCIVVAGATFDPSLATVQQYCDKPMWWVQKQPVFNRKLETARSHNDVKEVRGILYRPRMPYRVLLFIKSDLGKAGGWKLRKAEIVAMENISPVISVGVDRTFFAQRKTALVFDQGTLTNVCIYKGAELVKFAEIPLEVVKSVVALPTTILQLRLVNTNNETELVKAHDAILRKQDNMVSLITAARGRLQQPDAALLAYTNPLLDDVDAAGKATAISTSADFNKNCPLPVPFPQ